jgi:2-keto-4-pentenoate hydratase/2-oxohepta-3-ene-1,7-dioic acid hydratase in catechol pathway
VRLVRYLDGEDAAVGIVDGTVIRRVRSRRGGSLRSMIARRELLETEEGPGIPLAGAGLLPPIDDPGKIVAIGLNYADHAAEGAMVVPGQPLVFAKFPSSIAAPGDAIAWPADVTDAVDYEAELAVIIGRTASRVTREEALDHVFGYTCLNDVTARDIQFSDGQWVRGKSLDTFCPIGPWIVTADDIPDPGLLGIRCVVSGETLQDASTADMFFGVPELISRLSRSFVLEPGDVIATGTPPGVGWFRDPRRLLRAGDVVTVEIEGIGALVNPVAGPRQPT